MSETKADVEIALAVLDEMRDLPPTARISLGRARVLASEVIRLRGVKNAYRYYIDATDEELRRDGLTREAALTRARELDADA